MKTITGIVLKTSGEAARITMTESDSLEKLQAAVAGYIEIHSGKVAGRECSVVMNEEGLIHDLPVNVLATDIVDAAGQLLHDGIRGDVVILGPGADDEGDMVSLAPDQIESLTVPVL